VPPFIISDWHDRYNAPPAVGSPEYLAAVQQVQSLGAIDSTTRTPDQTEIAYFWSNDKGAYQQFSFWWTGVRPKDPTGLEKDWAASFGRLGLIQGRDGGARQPAERRAALL